MPDVYHDPIHGPSREPFTHYAALVGPSAVFRPDGPKQAGAVPRDTGGTRVVDITDGVDSTLAVSCVEPARKIPWTKPEDIDVGPGFKGFGKPGGIAAPFRTAGRPDVRCAPFLLAGGFTKTIATSIEPAKLLALIPRAGGEAVRFADMPAVFSPVGRPKNLTIVIDGGKLKASIE